MHKTYCGLEMKLKSIRNKEKVYTAWLSSLWGHIFGMKQENTALPVFLRTIVGTSFNSNMQDMQ